MAAQISWNELKPFSNDPILHTGLRFEKIKVNTLRKQLIKVSLEKFLTIFKLLKHLGIAYCQLEVKVF